MEQDHPPSGPGDRPGAPVRAWHDATTALRLMALPALVVAAWVGLTFLRPGVTFHLAPGLVVWSLPYGLGGTSSQRVAVAVSGAGLAVAVAATVGLEFANRLTGPVLFGGTGLGESLWVAGLAAVVAVAWHLVGRD